MSLLALSLLALPLHVPTHVPPHVAAAEPIAPAQTTARPDVLAAVPADAVAVLHVESVGELRRALAASQWVRFLASDAGVAGALDAPELARVAALIDPAAPEEARAGMREEEREFLELVNLVSGGVAFYATAGEEPVFVAVLEPGPTLPVLAQRLAAFLEEEADAVTVARGGATVTLPSAALVDPAETDGALVALGDRVVALAGEDGLAVHAELQRVVERLAGSTEGGSVRDNPRFAAARAALRAPGQVTGFVDLAPLVAQLPAAEESSNPLEPDPGTVVDFLGVRQVGWAALGFRVGPVEELDFELAVHVPRGTWLARLADHLRPVPLAALARVPGDATSVGAWNVDVYGIYRTLLAGADTLHEGLGELISVQVTEFGSLAGVDLEEDVLALFTGEGLHFTPRAEAPTAAAAAGGAPTGESATGEAGEADALAPLIAKAYPAYWIGVRDAETLRDSLADLVAFGAEQVGAGEVGIVETERDGLTLHSLAGELEVPLVWTWTADALVVGLDAARVATLARGAEAGKSVLEDRLLGPHLTANARSAALSIGRTADTIEAMQHLFGGLIGFARTSGEHGHSVHLQEAEALTRVPVASFFSGVAVSSVERSADALHLRYFTR